EIEVIDGTRRHGNALLLPAGPMREPLERAIACDFHLVNGDTLHASELAFRLHGATLVGNDGCMQALASLSGMRVHAVAGIGNPLRFFDSLRMRGLELIEHRFSDHHAYSPQDLDFNDTIPIVMTEKDWVKCAAFAMANCWMLPVCAELDDRFLSALLHRLPSSPGAQS
ncbi:MAG: tetraacyldisaccharide 4'-kinase, partial [Lysobacteraceae bacterium]